MATRGAKQKLFVASHISLVHVVDDSNFPFAFYLVISGQGRDPVPSTLPVSKLATEIYDSDDGGNRTPPLIPRTVILKPSPSPESLAPSARSLSPECTGTLSRNKGPRRRQKTQPSQGDAVLIGFLGGQNCPDIATRAGEEPLNSASQSEAGDPNSPMDVEDGNPGENKGFNLIQTAQNALLVDGTDKPSGEKGQSPKSDETRRSLSRLQTRDLNASTGDGATLDAVGPIPTKRDSDNQTGPDNPQLFQAPVTDSRSAREESPERSPSTLGRPSTIRRSSSATSPLRKYAIAPSERSPMELLPAMQTSQPSLSAQSPSGQQTLPPLHSQFPNLVEDRSTNDKKSRTNVINTNRPHIPLLNSSLNSPPLTSLGTRPGQYPSPQTRLNGHFPHPYPPSQPSPASSYSDTSPRDNYRPNSDTSSLSPRGRFAPNQFYSNRRTSKSGELTPLSAESHKTSGKFGTDTSPDSDRVNVESGRPVLPPLGSSAPIVAGLFKCEHAGCTASPFQTQYLLNSHMNVHSQERPHYCPVKECNRSEGGKGFKRKNEMIRHGLVHKSPGYICPFCPEREHKYPRPDNLQRHVRVNHNDKDLNDPQLREVLAQRLEGVSRGRRRRVGG